MTNRLSKAKYINLETYKRNGEAVRTPVWFVEKNGLVYFHSMAKSWKVKRLKRNPMVRLAPCSMSGKIKGDWLKGKVTLIDGEEGKRIVKLVNSSQSGMDKIISFFEKRRERGSVAFSIKLEA